MMLFTYKKAVEIQRDQLAYYSRGLNAEGKRKLAEYIARNTRPCPIAEDAPISFFDLADLVPRGTAFETAEAISILLDTENQTTEQRERFEREAREQSERKALGN